MVQTKRAVLLWDEEVGVDLVMIRRIFFPNCTYDNKIE